MTYSIVARDAETGELGVAVQSHWFSVGSVVTWGAPGVGAVATQANAEISYGPRMLEAMTAGEVPQAALERLLAEDDCAEHRQVAAIDAGGRIAVHTGSQCMAFAGHLTGAEVSCQANMMRSERVWPAMLERFGQAGGPLATRLLAALDAGEAAGGDVRGRQSAAILVVPAAGEPWRRTVELRVEDHPAPLTEMRRLLTLHQAYVLATRGDELVAEARHEEAGRLYREACELAPESQELRFWSGLAAAQAGDFERAAEDVRFASATEPGWLELLGRLSPEVAPSAAPLREWLNDSGTAG